MQAMRHRSAAAIAEPEPLFTMSFENPELEALNAIARILQDLPDDAARMRVMRWAFGRYSEEFKRPLPGDPAPAPAAFPMTAAEVSKPVGASGVPSATVPPASARMQPGAVPRPQPAAQRNPHAASHEGSATPDTSML